MGRIKSTLIKRTARQFVDTSFDCFSGEFDKNKKSLGSTLPSKRLRNKVAGYVGRIIKMNKKIIEEKDG